MMSHPLPLPRLYPESLSLAAGTTTFLVRWPSCYSVVMTIWVTMDTIVQLRTLRGKTWQRRGWQVKWFAPEPFFHQSCSREGTIMPITMDTQQQNFWTENIQKEAALRFAWQLRYSKKFAKEAAADKPPQRKQPAGLHVQSNISERIRHIEDEIAVRRSAGGGPDKTASRAGSDASQRASRSSAKSHRRDSIRDMRPPSVATRSLLYSGISAHGEGRYAYLKKRKSMTPEQKYEFPVLSSCQYGWKILDFMNPNSKPSPFARTCVIRDSFYRNSGIILGWDNCIIIKRVLFLFLIYIIIVTIFMSPVASLIATCWIYPLLCRVSHVSMLSLHYLQRGDSIGQFQQSCHVLHSRAQYLVSLWN